MIVYAYLFTSCIHESAHAVMSLHATKAGAWRALRKGIGQRWADEMEQMRGRRGGRKRGWVALKYCAWTVQPMEVLP